MGAGDGELMDMMKTDFLLHYVHHYDPNYIDSITPIQRTLLISMLITQLEEEKNKKQN